MPAAASPHVPLCYLPPAPPLPPSLLQWMLLGRCCTRCPWLIASWHPRSACRTLHRQAYLPASQPEQAARQSSRLGRCSKGFCGLTSCPAVIPLSSSPPHSPMSRLTGDPTALLFPFLQVILTGDPALVAGAATLLLTVLQHNAGESGGKGPGCDFASKFPADFGVEESLAELPTGMPAPLLDCQACLCCIVIFHACCVRV